MRLNRFVALATGLSRRAADRAIAAQRVMVNERLGQLGDNINQKDHVTLDGQLIKAAKLITVMLNKPVDYVCSRDGQGSQTVYDLLPPELHHLKPIGRLDKDSSGLLLLTNDGELAQHLTHPGFQKAKIYQVKLDKTLSELDKQKLQTGIQLEDGPSQLDIHGRGLQWVVTIKEGRNRQIRRSFAALGYRVVKLHRTHFGDYRLGELPSKKYLLT